MKENSGLGKALLGYWKSTNVFITKDGEILSVTPMTYIYSNYDHLLPMYCFIQITNGSIISVVPIDDKIEMLEDIDTG